MSMKTLDPEAVLVAFAFVGEMMNQQQEFHRKSAKFFTDVRDCRDRLNRASRGEVITQMNPFKPGDWVEITVKIRDSYSEVWHEPGDILQVKGIAADGQGLMFPSDLGTHFANVKPAQVPKR